MRGATGGTVREDRGRAGIQGESSPQSSVLRNFLNIILPIRSQWKYWSITSSCSLQYEALEWAKLAVTMRECYEKTFLIFCSAKKGSKLWSSQPIRVREASGEIIWNSEKNLCLPEGVLDVRENILSVFLWIFPNYKGDCDLCSRKCQSRKYL